MNTSISRIFGVVLSVALIASLFTWAIPVAAAPGDMVWFKESITASGSSNVFKAGSDVGGFAVADASTIYAIDSLGAASNQIYKSTNTGQSFTNITNTYAGGAPKAIAVAPDNKDVLAVTDGVNVWISTDAGTTWTMLTGPGTALRERWLSRR